MYARGGEYLTTLEGKVVDFMPKTPVGKLPDGNIQYKDCLLVGGIKGWKSAYLQDEGEGLFALQDVEIINEENPLNLAVN